MDATTAGGRGARHVSIPASFRRGRSPQRARTLCVSTEVPRRRLPAARFRVDATLSSDSDVAGRRLTGVVGQISFGAWMESGLSIGKRHARSYAALRPLSVSTSRTTRFRVCRRLRWPYGPRKSEAIDGARHERAVQHEFRNGRQSGRPYRRVFEGVSRMLSRQRIAGRASFIVHPAPWYVGVMVPSYFIDQKDALTRR